MNTFVRVLLFLITFFGSFLSLFYIIFGSFGLIFGEEGPRTPAYIVAYIITTPIATLAGIYTWKQSLKRVVDMPNYAFKVGIISAFVFFLAGYIYSMVLNEPGAFGPMLAYMYAFPGFIIGIITGLIIESNKRKKSKSTAPGENVESHKNKFLKLLIALVSALAAYFISYWIILGIVWSIFGQAGVGKMANIPANILAILVGAYFGFVLWKNSGIRSANSHYFAIRTGLISGFAFFLVGFIGPMIFMPGANQGPLLGFLLGPIGLVIGIIAGLVIEANRKKKISENVKI